MGCNENIANHNTFLQYFCSVYRLYLNSHKNKQPPPQKKQQKKKQKKKPKKKTATKQNT